MPSITPLLFFALSLLILGILFSFPVLNNLKKPVRSPVQQAFLYPAIVSFCLCIGLLSISFAIILGKNSNWF